MTCYSRSFYSQVLLINSQAKYTKIQYLKTFSAIFAFFGLVCHQIQLQTAFLGQSLFVVFCKNWNSAQLSSVKLPELGA